MIVDYNLTLSRSEINRLITALVNNAYWLTGKHSDNPNYLTEVLVKNKILHDKLSRIIEE